MKKYATVTDTDKVEKGKSKIFNRFVALSALLRKSFQPYRE